MRFPRIVSLYVAREVLLHAALGLAAVSLVFVGQNLLRRLSELLMIGVGSADVLTIVRCIVEVTLVYTVPIAFLFGALAGIGRLASQGEIQALRACGVGIGRLLVPLVTLGLLVSCFTWYLALSVEHRAKRELRQTFVTMTASGRMIAPGRFTRVRERLFYVDSRDRENRLRRIFIADATNRERPLLIFAESGEFSFDPESGKASLLLRDGELHFDGGNGNAGGQGHVAFEGFEYAFAVPLTDVESRVVRPRDMTNEELRSAIATLRAGGPRGSLPSGKVEAYEVQLERRMALPFAPTLFALLALPLAARRGRGARAWGALASILVVGAYYTVLSFFQFLAFGGVLPPALALWSPNVVLAAVAVALLVRMRGVPR